MSIIEASSVRVATLADGTLRLTVDVEPRHARDAFALFGAPGVPMALAALKTAQESEPEAAPEKPKGGVWAQWCGKRCAEVSFRAWLREKYPNKWEHFAIGGGKHETEIAADVLRMVCQIESRTELDNDDEAKARFDRLIRGPWQKHYQAVNA